MSLRVSYLVTNNHVTTIIDTSTVVDHADCLDQTDPDRSRHHVVVLQLIAVSSDGATRKALRARPPPPHVSL